MWSNPLRRKSTTYAQTFILSPDTYYPHLLLSKNFVFSHEPISKRSATLRLLGRKYQLHDFKMRIRHSSGGAFLVTGYRGVGKTSFVTTALEELEQEITHVHLLPVYLNLSRTITPTEIMHHLMRQLYSELEARKLYKRLPKNLRHMIKMAYQRTAYAISYTHGTSVSQESSIAHSLSGIGLSWRGNRSTSYGQSMEFLGYDDKAAEYDIIRILRELNRGFRRLTRHHSIRPVIVFDELDKLSLDEQDGRDYLLNTISALKAIFTTSGSVFIFIGGIELYQVWLEDIQKPNSIYESVFAHEIYLPCLWDLPELLLIEMLEPEKSDPKLTIWRDQLRNYLAFKGRGVPRRMIRELNRLVSADPDSGAESIRILLDDDLQLRIRAFADMERIIEENFDSLTDALDVYTTDETQPDEYRLFLYYIADYIFKTRGRGFTREQLLEQFQSYPLFSQSARVGQILLDEFLKALINGKYVDSLKNEFKLTDFGKQRVKWALTGDYSVSHELMSNININGIKIINILGAGGIADVYEGQQHYQSVAVKVLRTKDDSDYMNTAIQIMNREREILAMELHENIVKLLSIGEIEPINYFVMELIDGVSLEDIIRSSKTGLSIDIAIPLMISLCDCVVEIHHAGFFRIDLNPSNIMLETGLKKRLVLLDVGTALSTEGNDQERHLYKTIGTKGYLAPEAEKFTPETTPTFAVDIYSLGIILYLLIVGRRGASALYGRQNIDLNEISNTSLRNLIEQATENQVSRRIPTVDRFRTQLSEIGINRSATDVITEFLVGKPLSNDNIPSFDDGRFITSIEKTATDVYFAEDEDENDTHLKTNEIITDIIFDEPATVRSIELHVYHGEKSDKKVYRFTLSTSITIGRAFDNALLIDDASVSRYNAVISTNTITGVGRDIHTHTIERMRDSSQVLINDNMLIFRDAQLQHGDLITIGNIRLHFILSEKSILASDSD